MIKTSYFTFGQAHRHEINGQKFDKTTVAKITVPHGEPTDVMFEVFGKQWAFEYCDHPPEMTQFPGGIIEIQVDPVEAEPEPAKKEDPKPETATEAPKRKRGRPRKTPLPEPVDETPTPEPGPEPEPEPADNLPEPSQKSPGQPESHSEEEVVYEEPEPEPKPVEDHSGPEHETPWKATTDLYLDIETGPLPDDRLEKIIPTFNPDSVALGNTKDPEKIAAKVEEKRASHVQDFKDRAALDPKYGMILGIGMASGTAGSPAFIVCKDLDAERDAIRDILDVMEKTLAAGFRVVGFNIKNFDLMFIRRRAFVHGIPIPRRICSPFKGRMYWNEDFVDLMHEWLGPGLERDFSGNGLDAVCKAVIGFGKKGNGKHFSELFKTDPKAAIDYALWDVHCTQLLGKVLIQDNATEETRRRSTK